MYLKECLDSTFVSSVGKFLGRFEYELAAFTGAKPAVAVVNGDVHIGAGSFVGSNSIIKEGVFIGDIA